MGSFIDIDGDPNEVRGTGAKIRAMAETFGVQVRGISGQISAKDSGQPWGSDQWGREFDAQYNQMGDDGVTASQGVKNGLTRAGEVLEGTGDRVLRAMDGYQLAEYDNERDINSARR